MQTEVHARRSQQSSQSPRHFPIHCLSALTKNGHPHPVHSQKPGPSLLPFLQVCTTCNSTFAPVEGSTEQAGQEQALSAGWGVCGEGPGTPVRAPGSSKCSTFTCKLSIATIALFRCRTRCEPGPFPPPLWTPTFLSLAIAPITLFKTVLEQQSLEQVPDVGWGGQRKLAKAPGSFLSTSSSLFPGVSRYLPVLFMSRILVSYSPG